MVRLFRSQEQHWYQVVLHFWSCEQALHSRRRDVNSFEGLDREALWWSYRWLGQLARYCARRFFRPYLAPTHLQRRLVSLCAHSYSIVPRVNDGFLLQDGLWCLGWCQVRSRYCRSHCDEQVYGHCWGYLPIQRVLRPRVMRSMHALPWRHELVVVHHATYGPRQRQARRDWYAWGTFRLTGSSLS